MLTTDYQQTYGNLPNDLKLPIMALGVLIQRIGTLPRADRDDLFELLQAWRNAQEPEEQQSLQEAMEEILAQMPITVRSMPLGDPPHLARGLKPWAEHVGTAIRKLREGAGFSQAQLAEQAGLTQSHVSRLENAEHSATNLTLEKIAKALGTTIAQIDPCAD